MPIRWISHLGRRFLGVSALLILIGCGSESKDPVLFLPQVLSPEGADLESLRSRYCRGLDLDLSGDVLTKENFQSVFNCANYDKSLEGLRPLVTSREFLPFLDNMNLILKSESTRDLKETLRHWLEEGPQGTSRSDRLLNVMAKVIKNPSFQDGLPLIHRILEAGRAQWEMLLPRLASIVYEERFPDTFSDLGHLFRDLGGENNHAVSLKQWARFLQSELDGKTVAFRSIELADRIKEVRLEGTSLQEYLDHMNEKGVFVSLYLDTGAVRGEVLHPKLNADPDEDELRDGIELTPEQRRAKAYKKLFARGKRGEDAPILQLVTLVEKFHQPRPDFIPAISRWFSANGPKVVDGITEYVVKADLVSNLSRLSIESYLNAFAREIRLNPRGRVTGAEFVEFLNKAFASPGFAVWVQEEAVALNQEIFGQRNGEMMRNSRQGALFAELYRYPQVAGFGATLIEDEPVQLSTVIRRFANLHRGEVEIAAKQGRKALESHLIDAWWQAANDSMGEGVVLEFVVKLAQTLFAEIASDFEKNGMTLSEWYFSSPYGNPDSTEALAGYAFKELDLFPKYYRHKNYLKNEFAREVFPDESDREAFSYLVDQIPNIWLYLKSGMSRSGNDLTRALASKDQGYLIRKYVELLVNSHKTGWLREGVRLLEAYQKFFPPEFADPKVSDGLEERRKVSKGADSLKRLMRALFEPEAPNTYETSTLGRLLVPVSSLVSADRRNETERFLLTSARVVLETSDKELNDFFSEFVSAEGSGDIITQRENLKSVADLLRDPVFPDVIRQLNSFFREGAVKPALDYFAEKVDDGSLPKLLLFLRRVLGFRG